MFNPWQGSERHSGLQNPTVLMRKTSSFWGLFFKRQTLNGKFLTKIIYELQNIR